MRYNTDDTRITGMQEVVAPASMIAELPLSDHASRLIFTSRAEIADIVHGRDSRLLVVIGPCSIHDPEAALDYAQRLREAAGRLRGSLKIVMRVYFEKPRTKVGWKGLINDPHLDDSFEINEGLHLARRVLLEVAEMGVAAGTEYLDPISPQYFGDLISWGAIGARTTESQIHRQLASGLSCPIGFKNSTLGSVQVAVDALGAARGSHIFLSVTKAGHSAIFSTAGNEDCHIILRGGANGPNYDRGSVRAAAELLERAGLPPRLMIDASHANSNKDYRKQIEISSELAERVAEGDQHILGVMLESNLVEGSQRLTSGAELIYGQSITDPCLGWEDSLACLEELAAAAERRLT